MTLVSSLRSVFHFSYGIGLQACVGGPGAQFAMKRSLRKPEDTMARTLKLTTCAVTAMLLAVCAPREDELADTALVDTGAAAITPTTPGATVAPAPTDTPRVVGPGVTGPVHARLSEWRVVLSQRTAPEGWIQLHAMNEGQQTHALDVERGGLEWRTADIRPGGIAVLWIYATPGTYNVYCPLSGTAGNHRTLGMSTTLTVTAR
jgi:hypothetical protein